MPHHQHPLKQNTLKRKLSEGQATYGLWVTLESPTITEIAVALGLDWIVIDAEHGHLDFKEIVEHLRAARHTSTTALVRIQEIEQGLIKRVLDIGADGIVVPQITSPEEIEQAVRFAKYPPWGVRGIGAERSTNWGIDLRAAVGAGDEETLVIPMIETVAAGRAIDAILDIRGVDAVFFGPADYSASAGYPGEWEAPSVTEDLRKIRERICSRGIPCGIIGRTIEEARLRQEQGFRLIGLGADTGLLIRSLGETLNALRIHDV